MEDFILHMQTYWPFYAVMLGLIVLIAIMTAGFILSKKKDEEYELSFGEQSNSVRIFIIDIPNDSVRFFNVMTMRRVSVMRTAEFYSRFPVAQQQRVINWVNALSEPGSSAPEYLETQVLDKHTHKHYFSILKIEHVDYEKGVVHILSYLMKSMVAGRIGKEGYGLSSISELETAIAESGKAHGFTACYRFQYRKTSDKDLEIETLLFYQLKNVLLPLIGPRGYLTPCSGNDLLFTDLKINEKHKIRPLIQKGLTAIYRFLALNGLANTLEVRVGIVEHGRFASPSEAIVEAAKNTALIAYEENTLVLFYETGRKISSALSDTAYRTEVERIIDEKKIHYYFRPIYSIDRGRVTGYFTKAVPNDAYFESMDELKDYAVRTEDDKALFSTIVKDTIHLYIAGNTAESNKLFFPIRMQERSHLLTTFSRLTSARSLNIVFMLDQDDVLSSLSSLDVEGMFEFFRLIKAKGYQIALSINGQELNLPQTLYSQFDYFAVSFSASGSTKEMDALVRSQLHALVEKLLKYNKPIIASDVVGWDAIELVVSSGMRFVSAEAFAPYDLMLNPPSPKSLKRMKEIV